VGSVLTYGGRALSGAFSSEPEFPAHDPQQPLLHLVPEQP
jgi:hypothetical protein